MSRNTLEERVIIIAPVGQDASAMAALLKTSGLEPEISSGPGECSEKIPAGAGAVLLTEETLELPRVSDLFEVLKAQPSWSELPFIILTSGGEPRLARLLDLMAEAAGSLIVLERPITGATLLRSVQVALRLRRRQYQVRDLIDQQRLDQQQLQESAELLRVAIKSSGIILTQSDRDLRYRWIYNAHPGFDPQSMVGKRDDELQQSEGNLQLFALKQRVIQTGVAGREDLLLDRGQGLRTYSVTVEPLRNTNGESTGVTSASFDITERKRAEEALRQAKEELARLNANLEKTVQERTVELRSTNEQLETYVYSVAHDLRAPLRSISAYSQILLDDHAAALEDTPKQLLKRVQASSEFMDKLLLDLLAFGRTARAEMELGPVDVQEAWDHAFYQCETQVQETRAQVEVAGPLPKVRAHEATLTQSLANLLSNSLKFVAPGVRPSIRFWAEQRGNWVRLWLQDNGIGIPEREQNRAFRVFERLNGTRYPGTGIGLSIVRKGTERMGGTVGLESIPGQGSRFWIELPSAN